MSISLLHKLKLLIGSLLFFSMAAHAQTYNISSCSGSNISFVQPGAPAGTTYTWLTPVIAPTNSITNGSANLNPQNQVAQTLFNNTSSLATATYQVTTSNSTTFSLVVTVNPLPQLSSPITATVCTGTTFSYAPGSAVSNTSFNWSRPAVTGISNTAAQGTNNPNEVLNNTTTNSIDVTYNYTLSANGCSNNQSVVVTVFPKPNMTSPSIAPAICSGTAFSYSPTSSVNGTTFNWSRQAITGISNAAAQGSFNPNETLNNTTTNSIDVTYNYTLTANGCSNNQAVTVTVLPKPALTSSLTAAAICSGGTASYTPTSSLSNTSFNWSRPLVTGISNAAGQGTNNPNEILNNTTVNAINVIYNYTLTANGCSNVQAVSLTVSPAPSLTSPLIAPAICSGGTAVYQPASNISNTSFNWSRPAVSGISNAAAQGSNNPNEILYNTTINPINVIYNYTLTANGCSSNQAVTLSVSPTPSLTSPLIAPGICSGGTAAYIPVSSLPNTSFNWSRPAVTGISNAAAQGTYNPNEVLNNTTTSSVNVTYNYTLTTGGCSNTQAVTLAVSPIPSLTSSLTIPAICSGGTVFYSPTSNLSNTTFNWSRPVVAGISNTSGQGTNNPNEVLNNTSNNPVNVNYNYTLTANGCANTQAVVVTVSPLPSLTSPLIAPAICSGGMALYTPASNLPNTSFSWSRAVVTGISAGAQVGTNGVNEQLNNTTLIPRTVTYVYTLTSIATGCSNIQNVSLTVNPVPSIPAQTISSCSGTVFMLSPSPAPAGTTYTWQTPVITPAGAISGGSANTIGLNYVGQALVNNTSNPATAVYTVTPSTYGCIGTNFTATVTVNATGTIATLSSSLTPPDICSGNAFFYHPVSAATGASFSWTRFLTAGISQNPQSGIGDINETLNNTTYLPVTVKYAITLTVNGCANTQDIAVVVNPATALNTSQTPPAICSNTVFSYAPSSFTAGTSFNWSRTTVTGISNAAASGVGNPNETLINTTSAAIAVSYNYALITANGCTNNQSVVVYVNPTPTLSSTPNPSPVCSGSVFNYLPTSNTAGAVFNWNRPVTASISNGAGNGTNNPGETLVNTGITPVNVLYTYTITANGCSNTAVVTVAVNPVPNITNQSITACSNTTFNLTPVNVPANTTYTWAAPAINPANSIIGGAAQPVGQNSIGQLLTNLTINPVTAVYTVTPSAGSCSSASFTVTVTLNPVPAATNQLLNAICSGNAFSYTPANMPTGTTYTWSNPLLSPVNSLTGGSAQPVSQVSIGQSLSSVNNLIDTAFYTVTPTTNGCSGNTFAITMPVKPVPIVYNLTDTVCSATSFTIIPAPVPANTTYTWTTPVNFPFGSVINGTQQQTPVPSISQTLINTTNATAQSVYNITPVSSSCAGAPFTLTVIVGVPLPPIGNQSSIICSGTSFNMTPATAPPGTTYTWSVPVVSPPGSVLGLSAATVPQTIISQTLTNLTNVNDTVVYFVRPYNTGCLGNIFTATVRVMPSPKVNITGSPVICAYPFDTLSISFTGNAPWSFNYLDTNGVTRTVPGIKTSPYTWITPSRRNSASQTFTISGIKEMACSNLTDTFYFSQKINRLPIGKIVSLHGIYICGNILDTMYVVTLPIDTVSYQWFLNGSPITGATGDSIATRQPGNYNARLTNQFGCMDTAAANIGLIMINKPILNFSYDSYCINRPIRFTNLTDTTYTGPIQWLWNLGDSTTASTYHTTDTYVTGGDRHIRLMATQTNCAAYSLKLDTTITIQFPIAPVRLPSVSAYKGVPVLVSGRYLPGYSYLWNPTRGITSPNSDSTIFNHSQTQQYLVNLISPGGCYTPDTLMVRVFDNNLVTILVPKSFTPNGDGVNDLLYPYQVGIKEFHYFKIYNRYGQLMFETKNPDTGWNGTAGGTPQPMGIYIWISEGIANDGSLVRKTGETLLLR